MILSLILGHNGVVELLLKRGVDVDERSSKGWSALDFAVLNGHVMSANTLIFYGAIVDDGPKVCSSVSTERNSNQGSSSFGLVLPFL